MKGQIFLIMAMIMIVTLMTLKTSLNLVNIIENKKYLETGLDRKEFDNIRNELVETIDYTSYQPTNITDNVNNYINFVKNSLMERAVNLNGFAVLTYHPTISSSIDTSVNVTVLNFFGTQMNTLTINFNNNTWDNRSFTSVADGTSKSVNFTFNTNTNRNYTLSVYYVIKSENRTNDFNISADIGKSKFIGFFDLRMVSDRSDQRDKFTQTYVIP